MFNIDDQVRLSEAARQEFITSGDRGPHVDAAREYRVGSIVKQVGERDRHMVIVYLVDFEGVYMTVPEEDLLRA